VDEVELPKLSAKLQKLQVNLDLYPININSRTGTLIDFSSFSDPLEQHKA
jgi:hypothetical protein